MCPRFLQSPSFVLFTIFKSDFNLNSFFFFQIKICENRQPSVIFILNLHFCLIIYLLTNWTEAMLSCRFATTYHRFAELPPKLYQFCYLGQFATMIKSFATMMGSFATRIGGFAK